MITAGVDMGSRTIKVVLIADGRVVARALGSGGFDPAPAARARYEQALREAGLDPGDVVHVTATGGGRERVEFAGSRVTEITAAARAANHLFPGATTVVDVGAEESRAIKTDGNGRVLDVAVNDKCAAGSGIFTESMARALGMSLDEFARRSTESTVRISMNAQCTVFAESEVVSLIHAGVDPKDIARAVHDAIASRVGAMVRRVRLEEPVVLMGGMARNVGFVGSLKENLQVGSFRIPDDPVGAVALGAALIAAGRAAAQEGKAA